jgi:hypothetical protein
LYIAGCCGARDLAASTLSDMSKREESRYSSETVIDGFPHAK